MSQPPLKLFSSCDWPSETSCASTTQGSDRRQREIDRITGTAKAKTLPVAFGDFVKLLSRAIEDDCTWLEDFAEDSIQIDADLHEVLLSYEQLRRRNAA